jgi:magnesium chelatase subunit I
VEEIARTARTSPHVNQQSGVSVRMSISNAELLISNAERRALKHGERLVVPRISDLQHVSAGCRGKVELMLADDEKAEDKLVASIIGEAVKEVFDRYAEVGELESVVEAFSDRGMKLETGDEVSTKAFVASIERAGGLKKSAIALCEAQELPRDEEGYLAAVAEFILEALYVNNRLSKYAVQGRTVFKR